MEALREPRAIVPRTKYGWPKKTRELWNHHLDSAIWNDFVFRDDDIVIATYAKSGTTWTQQIVVQLLFGGATDLDINEISQFIDLRADSKEERLAALDAQHHRRVIKTHTPVEALVYSPRAKYLYVARDGRDVAWSLHNHLFRASDHYYERINEGAAPLQPLMRPSPSVADFFAAWFARDGHPWGPWWAHVRSWWDIRHLPNLLLVHYTDLKADLPGEVRRIASFLDIPVDAARWPAILEQCSFDFMKRNASVLLPRFEKIFDGGAQSFINKGTNGRWRDVLAPDLVRRYEAATRRELGEACAAWTMNGGRPSLSSRVWAEHTGPQSAAAEFQS
jgi:aryl sulfotransferase